MQLTSSSYKGFWAGIKGVGGGGGGEVLLNYRSGAVAEGLLKTIFGGKLF